MRIVSTLFIAPVAIAVALAGCSGSSKATGESYEGQGSGETTTRNFPAKDFTGVELAGSDDVQISTGKAFSVRATGEAKALDRLDITVEDGSLHIGTKRNSGWSWGSRKSAKIYVTMPTIDAAGLSGSGTMTIDRAQKGFHGSIAGSGDISVGMINGGNVSLSTTGSGTLSAAGTADLLKIGIQGSGDVKARDLKASSASVSIAGSGNAVATVDGDADVSIMGSGDVDLGPNARCHVSKMGSGDARCGG